MFSVFSFPVFFFRFSFFRFFFFPCFCNLWAPHGGAPPPKMSFQGRLDTNLLVFSRVFFFLCFLVVSGQASVKPVVSYLLFFPFFFCNFRAAHGVLSPLEGFKNVILGPFRHQFPSLFWVLFFFLFFGWSRASGLPPPPSPPTPFFFFRFFFPFVFF